MTTTRTEGTLFQETKSLDVKQISSLIRNEIRKSAKEGLIPSDWKYSVRLKRYGWSSAIDIEIRIPKDVSDLRWSAPFAYDDARDRDAMIGEWESLGRLFDTKQIIEEIHESFNFYESFFPDDGCASRYFGHVSIVTESEEEQ